MNHSELLPAKLLSELAPWRQASRWLLGYSGGLDSSVLLHLLARLARDHALPPLLALHVDHQLQAASAAWREHCQRECAALGIELRCVAVNVAQASRTSPEDAARKARYAAFAAQLQPGDVLLLAHHADDQAETFLLRALRGAGVAGLAAMSRERVFAGATLVRPLLDVGRNMLALYAAAHQINYVDDPSNDAIGFDRNYVRHEIVPRLQQRWPDTANRFNVAAQHMAEANLLLREMARDDLARCSVREQWGAPSIELAPLAALSPERQRNALRYFLETSTMDTPLVLSQQQLLQLQQQWFSARDDASPCLDIGGMQLRRYRGRGYVVTPLPPGVAGSWDFTHDLDLPGLGCLRASVGQGGLRVLEQIDVRFRRGGERFCSDGVHHRPLKQWLQENGVPPWLRDHLPLLFYQGELVAIADLAIAKRFRVPDHETGLRITIKGVRLD